MHQTSSRCLVTALAPRRSRYDFRTWDHRVRSLEVRPSNRITSPVFQTCARIRNLWNTKSWIVFEWALRLDKKKKQTRQQKNKLSAKTLIISSPEAAADQISVWSCHGGRFAKRTRRSTPVFAGKFSRRNFWHLEVVEKWPSGVMMKGPWKSETSPKCHL